MCVCVNIIHMYMVPFCKLRGVVTVQIAPLRYVTRSQARHRKASHLFPLLKMSLELGLQAFVVVIQTPELWRSCLPQLRSCMGFTCTQQGGSALWLTSEALGGCCSYAPYLPQQPVQGAAGTAPPQQPSAPQAPAQPVTLQGELSCICK